MSALCAANRIQWLLRNTTSSVLSPLQSSRCFQRRLLCSTSSNLLPSDANNEPAGASPQGHTIAEFSLPCLLDMGFTQTQAKELYESLRKAKSGSAAKNRLSTLTVLFMLGLNPSNVWNILTKCPDLYIIKESVLQQRINYLRKLGLVEGSLQRVVSHYPAILTLPTKMVKYKTMFLREKCHFTVQQVTDILRDSPAVMHEDLVQLEYMFQYVYFRMGIQQAKMVKHKLFRYTLEELRTRHSFLERRGLYHTPDKKGQTVIVNPKLDSILNVDLDTFLEHVAKASAEEYDVFRKLVVREWKEEEHSHEYSQAESEDDDSHSDGDCDGDDDDDEEDKKEGKASYMKKRRK
ncbi:transcription termination factor 4, mitochondrial [Syngnathus scovelli]|uniref:transcription termination factor 4, mitochondrial n=1 Tax=Syngnathus scovelli TaxID=161590 RepID=UPI0021105BF1|nr:transcription termination factor 4, mitochondrial [Syngnathus scovelli]